MGKDPSKENCVGEAKALPRSSSNLGHGQGRPLPLGFRRTESPKMALKLAVDVPRPL